MFSLSQQTYLTMFKILTLTLMTKSFAVNTFNIIIGGGIVCGAVACIEYSIHNVLKIYYRHSVIFKQIRK